jgi:amidohydrolase
MFLSESDLAELASLRRRLHERPELSGEERETAAAIAQRLRETAPDRLIENLGGHGLAATYQGAEPGPTLMFRAELDGLPIEELSDAPYRSKSRGRGHLCGHDGHMATLMALALAFRRLRPKRGRAVLLFQPAEENGAGAQAVLSDPRFAEITPDFAFAWHNMPGLPLGRAALKSGPVNCASRGLLARLTGKTAHASMPQTGLSPMGALARLMPALAALSSQDKLDADYRLITVTHARLGEPAFGVAPGEAAIYATLRTLTDDGMAALISGAEGLVREIAQAEGLGVDIAYSDVFAHCENAPEAVDQLARALSAEGVPFGEEGLPMRASEDFGRFRAAAPCAMFLLGAGESRPSLHNPDYDFPDELISIAARVMMRVARDTLG